MNQGMKEEENEAGRIKSEKLKQQQYKHEFARALESKKVE